MKDLYNIYQHQLESVAYHAKLIGFDPKTGDFNDLMQSWIKSCNEFQESYKKDPESFSQLIKILTK